MKRGVRGMRLGHVIAEISPWMLRSVELTGVRQGGRELVYGPGLFPLWIDSRVIAAMIFGELGVELGGETAA